jgi:hypothetical protein
MYRVLWAPSPGTTVGDDEWMANLRKVLDPRILALLGVGEVDTQSQDVGVAVGKISD